MIDQVKIFLSLTRPHSRICIRLYIFNFKIAHKKQRKQNAEETKKKREYLWKI